MRMLPGGWGLAAGGLAAGGLVLALAALETADASLLLGRVLGLGWRVPVPWVVLAGGAAMAALLLALDRRTGLLALWRGAAGAWASDGGPRAQALAALCLAAVAVLLYHAVGLPDRPGPDLVLATPIDAPLVDVFHEGEMLAGYPIVQRGAEIPVLIHGPGRNILPGALAVWLAEPGYGVVAIRFVAAAGHALTAGLLALAAGLFAALMLEGAPAAERRQSAAAAALLALAMAASVGFLSNRFLVFLALLSLTALMVARPGRAPYPALLAGGLAAVSPLHVYSATVEAGGVVALGLVLLALRDWRAGAKAALALGCGGLAGLALALALGAAPLYAGAVRDILYWGGEARGLWAHATKGGRAVLGIALMTAILGLAIALAWRAGGPLWRMGRGRALLWLMAGAGLATSRNMWERPDIGHVGMALVTGACIAGALGGTALAAASGRARAAAQAGMAVLALATLGWALTGGAGPALHRSVAALATPDTAILPERVQAFAAAHRARLEGRDCLLVLTNEGALNYATGLPPCGGVLYPVYAGAPAADRRLADWLRANPQPLAVTATPFWSDRIDGRPMARWLAHTFAVVDATLPREVETAGRRVRLPEE
ncbi:MAG: hypothetical protein AAFV49_09510 [Pseudomonadota bacterium]